MTQFNNTRNKTYIFITHICVGVGCVHVCILYPPCGRKRLVLLPLEPWHTSSNMWLRLANMTVIFKQMPSTGDIFHNHTNLLRPSFSLTPLEYTDLQKSQASECEVLLSRGQEKKEQNVLQPGVHTHLSIHFNGLNNQRRSTSTRNEGYRRWRGLSLTSLLLPNESRVQLWHSGLLTQELYHSHGRWMQRCKCHPQPTGIRLH